MDQVDSEVKKYLNTISAYDNEFKKWEGRVTKIIKRYRDDTRSAGGNDTAKFNILWSNVQTLIPAVYAKLPKADVTRRFGDNDPVGRVASLLIERALDFEIEHYPDFRATMKYCVEDRFLGGRGTAWVRYEPHVREQDIPEDGLQITEDVENEAAEGQTPEGYEMPDEANVEPTDLTAGAAEVPEEIAYECAPTDYVHWKDFGHNIARTWEEVTEVWRWVYMNEGAIIERFGEEKAKTIPMDSSPEPLSGYGNTKKEANQARICELWCKTTGKVYWISKNCNEFIDVRDDPLGLEEFFPCPKPLYATTTSDTLMPVPDFILYQDQANELDILSDRIDGLVKALRVRGVYDASQPALQRLMTEGDNNSLIPIDKWMGFSEKGGLKGSIDLLPLDTLSAALLQCYQARADIKAQIYEITGISDIVRGQTAATETATAQQIKGQYAGLRLRAMQEEVALFATEMLRLKAQMICTKFQAQTILAYAAADQMSDADKELIPQALELLSVDPLRSFRIDVAADSLVQIDENQNKQDRLEFLSAFSGFLREAIPAAQTAPQIVPMLVDMMKFGVGAFKGARPIEGSLDRMLDQFKEQQAQPQQPQPDPEMMKFQAQQQADQMRAQADAQAAQAQGQIDLQIEQTKLQAQTQADMQIEQVKVNAGMQIEQMKAQNAVQIEQMRMEFEQQKYELEAATKVLIAQIGAKASLDQSSLAAQQAAGAKVNEELDGQAEVLRPLVDMHNEAMGAIKGVMEQMSRPKRIIRDAEGRVEGVQ
jgi:hypothetical protein